jgi:hypothetical protein
MTPETFIDRYFLATGITVDTGTATELLKSPDNPWYKKILKMADDVEKGSIWSSLSGVYTEVKS